MTDFAQLVLDADTRGLKRGEKDLDRIGKQAGKAAGDVDASSGKMAIAFGKVAAAAGAAWAAFGGVRAIIQTNAEFGASMQKVAAISGATGAQFDELREKAIELGAATMFSASEAADALGFLAMAGFSASESLAAIQSVLDLAAASGMGLAQAADITSNVLSGFGKEAEEAALVADVLAKASSVSNTNVEQLGQAMSTAAPIAAALGISMEETAAAIGVMSDAGIQGSRAGTALRGVFASLAGPTTQAQEALAKYGLSARDVDPQIVGLTKAMATLQERGLSTADAMIIFGREAASGALVMAGTAERMRELTSEFENAEGAAAAMAAVMADNLKGDIDELSSAVEGFIIRLGDAGVTGALRSMTQFGAKAIEFLSTNMSTLITVVASAAGGWLAYKATMIAVGIATTAMSGQLGIVITTLATVRAQVGMAAAAKVAFAGVTAGATTVVRGLTAALIANPFTAVAVAVGVLSAAMIGLSTAQRQARAETDNLIRSLRGLAEARSKDYALQRNQVEIERNRAQQRLAELENRRSGLTNDPLRGNDLATGMRLRSIEKEAQQLRWDLLTMNSELDLADKAFKNASAAAKSMEVPVAQSATAVGNLSAVSGKGSDAAKALAKATREAGRAAKEAEAEFARLMDRIFPEEAKTRNYLSDIARISGSGLSEERQAEARRRLALEAIGPDAVAPTDILDVRLDGGVGKNIKGFTTAMEVLGVKTKAVTVRIAKTFKDMADETIGALQRMTSAIQGGSFLDILGSVIGLGIQLGSIGAFGSKIQTNINSVPGRVNGGAVSAGQSYLVGESRPEVFTPNQNGFITPSNDNGATHITVGIDPHNGNITAFVNGKIIEASPAIANAGSQQAQAASAKRAHRTIRR
ncbi:phage tail tape measure protein [Parasphingorhabdus sp. JC815]|uniref:phage tail tape measure protein n=1 Tax=Parasphingorhabdus sp. JC815 TaxID=3232140 RepID=UPI003457497E